MSSSACAAETAAACFAAAMAAAGGWEGAPLLAVGLSGGPDSLALALLAQHWAAARGGGALALVLDHGIRPAARTEAALAAAWAGAAGLGVRRLRLPAGQRASAGALREARLAALTDAAAVAGALHLLLGHHGGDQAETVLLRLLGGSGARGLAAMAPVRIAPRLRILRPVLLCPPAALRAFLAARGQGWIADPSNEGAGTRARLRRAMADAGGEGAATLALAAAAATHARQAASAAAAYAALLARAASLPDGGGVMLDGAALAAASPSLREAALAAVLTRVSGRAHPPRGGRLARGAARLLADHAAFTLGGCLLRPRGEAWHVTAERRGATAQRAIASRRWPAAAHSSMLGA